jgi:uncharacterized protein YjbI with pentapeptide repeats
VSDARADQIAKLKQSITSLEEQQRATNQDLSTLLTPLREILEQLEPAQPTTPISNRSGGIDAIGGTLSAQGDVVGRDKIETTTTTTLTHTGPGASAQGAGASSASSGGIAIGGGFTGNVYVGVENAVEKRVPRQIPRPVAYYAHRPQDETLLHSKLINSSETAPIVGLWGLSGTGKTTLAASVLRSLSDESFPDGILWGDLASHEPNELLWNFMSALDSRWRQADSADHRSLREDFWSRLDGKCALLVLDNVKDARQIDDMLPDDLGHNRVLFISILHLTTSKLKSVELQLGPFKEEESLALFAELIAKPVFDEQQSMLLEICQRLGYLPQLVANAALSLAQGKLWPSAYLRMLRDSAERGQLLGRSTWDSLNVSVQALTPEQLDVFELTGVLGDGDWHYHMLAAVTLQRRLATKETLDVLVANGLIESAGGGRYRVNSLIREYVQDRLSKRGRYLLDAAHHLLARYCLDIAQDLEAALSLRPAFSAQSHETKSHARQFEFNRGFTEAFREGLLPEISHIRKILEWAEAGENWELILRFSYLPHMGLVQGLHFSQGTMLAAFRMAKLIEPVFGSDFQLPANPPDITITGDVMGRGNLGMPRLTGDIFFGAATAIMGSLDGVSIIGELGEMSATSQDYGNDKCDLGIDIWAGHIIDGVIKRFNLIDVKWIGVRAGGLVLQSVDLIGGRLVACDFSRSIWIDCDARRATFTGSNLSQAVLKNISLRGANLRDVNLSGTVLDTVDFRGADLRGANLTNARFNNINLVGAKLDDVDWAGARGHITAASDGRILIEEIRRAASRPSDTKQLAWLPDWRERLNPSDEPAAERAVADADMRGIDLARANLEKVILGTVDLRAATLSRSTLDQATLGDVDLSAADLSRSSLKRATVGSVKLHAAHLSHADLQGAIMGTVDLSAADLSRVDLSGSTLGTVNLSHSNLDSVNLEGATLWQVDLSLSNLVSATLHNATLTACNLEFSNLESASLTSAAITQSDLSYASLIEADLTGVVFQNCKLAHVDWKKAICVGTIFNGSEIETERLASAHALRGAIMPDGILYDGRFNCPGDLAAARDTGIDENDQAALAAFYASGGTEVAARTGAAASLNASGPEDQVPRSTMP